MKTSDWTMALLGAALFGVVLAATARAQTAEPPAAPQQPVAPPADAPAAAAPAAAQPAVAEPPAALPAAAAPAEPASAPKKAKPRKKKPATTIAVSVRNSRSAKLVELKAGLAGSDKMTKIAGPLAPGKTVAARVPRGKKDCLIDLSGTFDDGETLDATGVDACAQKLLNLTE